MIRSDDLLGLGVAREELVEVFHEACFVRGSLAADANVSSILVSLASWDVQSPLLSGRRAVLVFVWVVVNPVPIVLLSEAKAAGVDQRGHMVDIHIKGIRRRSEPVRVQ